jgi:hypothetical protein
MYEPIPKQENREGNRSIVKNIGMLTADQDPCGPMYDPVRNLYHLHYQFHPNHVNWGMISSHKELFEIEYLSHELTR